MLLQWFLFYLFVILLVGWRVKKYTGFLPAFALTYFLVSGAFVYAYRFNHFARNAQHLIPSASLGSLDVTVAIAAITIFAIYFSIQLTIPSFVKVIRAATILNALWVIFNFVARNRDGGNWGYAGLLDTSSLNGAVIAAGVPCVLGFGIWPIVICLAAIVLSISSVPWGVLLVAMAAYFIKQKNWLLACLTPLILAAGYLFEQERLFDSSGRFAMYRLFMTEWWKKGLHAFGTGMGSFQFIAPIIQCNNHFMMNENCEGTVIRQLHSDWLQLVFQFGFIGASVVLLLCLGALRRLYHIRGTGTDGLFAFFLGLLSLGLFSYPMSFAPISVALAICVVLSYRTYRSEYGA